MPIRVARIFNTDGSRMLLNDGQPEELGDFGQ
jgi:hypothetical protein